MELEFDVKISASVLYDYLLYHTYTSLSGMIGAVVGVFLLGGYLKNGQLLYLAGGIFILLYLPCTLWLKARKQAKNNPAFKEVLHYKMTEEGIEVSQHGETQLLKWEQTYKAVSTKSSIIVYINKMNAWIFPRKDLGELRDMAIKIISTHMPPDKVKIRG